MFSVHLHDFPGSYYDPFSKCSSLWPDSNVVIPQCVSACRASSGNMIYDVSLETSHYGDLQANPPPWGTYLVLAPLDPTKGPLDDFIVSDYESIGVTMSDEH